MSDDMAIADWRPTSRYVCRECDDVARVDPKDAYRWGCATCCGATYSVFMNFRPLDDGPDLPEALIARVSRFLHTDLLKELPMPISFELGASVAGVVSAHFVKLPVEGKSVPERYRKLLEEVRAALEGGGEHDEESALDRGQGLCPACCGRFMARRSGGRGCTRCGAQIVEES